MKSLNFSKVMNSKFLKVARDEREAFFRQQQAGNLIGAFESFQRTPECVRDITQWNSLLQLNSVHGRGKEVFTLFNQLRASNFAKEIDLYTLGPVLKTSLNSNYTRQIHCLIIKSGLDSDIRILNNLIPIYSKFCSLDDVLQVFGDIPPELRVASSVTSATSACITHGNLIEAEIIVKESKTNSVASNMLLAAYASDGDLKRCIVLAREAIRNGIGGDLFLYKPLLKLAAQFGHSTLLQIVHGAMICRGLGSDSDSIMELMDSYAKNDKVDVSCTLFSKLSHPEEAVYNALMMGFARSGQLVPTSILFGRMIKVGVGISGRSCLALQVACTEAGKVEEGLYFFRSMVNFGIQPDKYHFSNIIVMLARAGNFELAKKYADSCPPHFKTGAHVCLLYFCNDELTGSEILKNIDVKDLTDKRDIDQYYGACVGYLRGIGKTDEAHAFYKQVRGQGHLKRIGRSLIETASPCSV